jgi:hypothetical protein
VLVVENDVQERAVDLQSTVVVNEPHLSESVHEKTDPRSGCSYHLCKGLLADLGNYGLGRTFLAEMSKQEQDPSESFFAGIKELIDQVLFVSDVPGQQMRYEQI